ncbi:hypothetical protein Tco_0441310 [Tanacetum coccineum]
MLLHRLRTKDPTQQLIGFVCVERLSAGGSMYHWRIWTLVPLLSIRFPVGKELAQTACREHTDVPSNNIKESLFLKHGLVSRTYYKKTLIMASTFGSKSKSFMIMSIPSQDEPLTKQPVVSFMIEMPKNHGHY